MEIAGRIKRAAAVMISVIMIIGLCGSAMAEEAGSPAAQEHIAAAGTDGETGPAGTEGAGAEMCIRDSI